MKKPPEKTVTDNDEAPKGVQSYYRERLRAPWWWYLAAASLAALLGAEFTISGLPITFYVAFGVLIPVALAAVWSLGRWTLEVTADQVAIGDARTPLTSVTGIVALDQNTLRRVVGREGDPAAFVKIRPFVSGGVQIWLDDPADPTPYWVISTRHGSQVVDVMRSLGK